MSTLQQIKVSGRKIAPTIPNLPGTCDAATNPPIPFQMEQHGEEKIKEASFLAQVDTGKIVPELVSAKERQELVFDAVNEYVDQFHGFRQKTSESIIEMGRVVRKARLHLTAIQFNEFCTAIGFESQTSSIRKYELIGEQADVLSSHSIYLPNSWTSIYQLVQLAPVTLKKVLDDRTITPEITGKRIKEIIAENSPQKSSAKSTDKNCKKYHYHYGEAFDAPLDDEVRHELDKLIADYLVKNNIGAPTPSQLNGGK